MPIASAMSAICVRAYPRSMNTWVAQCTSCSNRSGGMARVMGPFIYMTDLVSQDARHGGGFHRAARWMVIATFPFAPHQRFEIKKGAGMFWGFLRAGSTGACLCD